MELCVRCSREPCARFISRLIVFIECSSVRQRSSSAELIETDLSWIPSLHESRSSIVTSSWVARWASRPPLGFTHSRFPDLELPPPNLLSSGLKPSHIRLRLQVFPVNRFRRTDWFTSPRVTPRNRRRSKYGASFHQFRLLARCDQTFGMRRRSTATPVGHCPIGGKNPRPEPLILFNIAILCTLTATS
jgi:hypothetical protein